MKECVQTMAMLRLGSHLVVEALMKMHFCPQACEIMHCSTGSVVQQRSPCRPPQLLAAQEKRHSPPAVAVSL